MRPSPLYQGQPNYRTTYVPWGSGETPAPARFSSCRAAIEPCFSDAPLGTATANACALEAVCHVIFPLHFSPQSS